MGLSHLNSVQYNFNYKRQGSDNDVIAATVFDQLINVITT
jgi:hypothetical protein